MFLEKSKSRIEAEFAKRAAEVPAVYSIEGKKVDHLTKTKCEWITQDNIKEKYDFLFPIY